MLYTFEQAEERVFGEILENKAEYKEDSMLQTRVKRYVLSGGKLVLDMELYIEKSNDIIENTSLHSQNTSYILY